MDLTKIILEDLKDAMREAEEKTFPHVDNPSRFPAAELPWREVMARLGKGLTPEQGGVVWLNPAHAVYFSEDIDCELPEWVFFHCTAEFFGAAAYVLDWNELQSSLSFQRFTGLLPLWAWWDDLQREIK